MKRMSHALVFVLCLIASGNAQEINYINDLAGKPAATFGDAVTLYVYTLGRRPSGFDSDVRLLKDLKILKGSHYRQNDPLRRGMLALMVARHLKLKGSFLFLMFDTRRYAHRACVAAGMMDVDTSELDIMTGEELLEVMALVAERMEAAK